jgi:hypothetical protein
MSSIIHGFKLAGEKLVDAKKWVDEAIEKNPTTAKVAKVAIVILAIVGAFTAIGLTWGWGLAVFAGVGIGYGAVLINRLFSKPDKKMVLTKEDNCGKLKWSTSL